MYANITLPLTLVSSKLNVPFSPRYFNGIKVVTAFKSGRPVSPTLKKPETDGKTLKKHVNLNQNSQKWAENK